MLNRMMNKIKIRTLNLFVDKGGAQLFEYVILALAALALGGILLNLFSGGITEIGGLFITKIKSVFSL